MATPTKPDCMFINPRCSEEFVWLMNCNKMLSKDMIDRYKLSGNNLLEYKLLLWRQAQFDEQDVNLKDLAICNYHRSKRGINFVPKRNCQHPLHFELKRSKHPSKKLFVTLDMSKEISRLWNGFIPVGEGMEICYY